MVENTRLLKATLGFVSPLVIAACLDFQITTEHVQVPTVDIYALAKKRSSKYGAAAAHTSRAKRQSLFRAETGPTGAGMQLAAPKPRSVSIFGSLLAQAAGAEAGTKDTAMLDDEDDDDDAGHGLLTRAQSDSVAMKASSSSSPLASLLKRAKRVKGACGARLKGGVESRRRRALDFSDEATSAPASSSTSASSLPAASSSASGGGGVRQRSPSGAVPSRCVCCG